MNSIEPLKVVIPYVASNAPLQEKEIVEDGAAKIKAVKPEVLSSLKEELCANKSKKMRSLSSQALTELANAVSEFKPCDQTFLFELQKVLIRNCGRRLWKATCEELESMSKSFTQAGTKDRDLQTTIRRVVMMKLKSK